MSRIRPILRRSNQTIHEALEKSRALGEKNRLELLELIRAEMHEESNRRLEQKRLNKQTEGS